MSRKDKKITRTIDEHKVRVAEVSFDKETQEVKTTELTPITFVNEGVNDEKILKVAKKIYGKNKQYVILGIESKSITYGLEFNKFMELAQVITK